MVPGTPCVLMDGILFGMRQKLSVPPRVLLLILVVASQLCFI